MINLLPVVQQFIVRLASPFCVAVSLAVTSAGAVADDMEIYRGLAGPKILFVLDASGSMGFSDSGYTGTRMDRMKIALSELLAGMKGVDVGVMEFSGNVTNGSNLNVELLHPVADVEDNQLALQAAVQGMTAGGGTPTVSALYEAAQYFRGAAPNLGSHQGSSIFGGSTYQTPVTQECESGHIILLTDGIPRQADPNIVQKITPLYGPCGTTPDPGGTCGAEFAEGIATTDQRSDLPGVNTLTTHAIGFNLESNWVTSVAAAGGGVYQDAASSQELLVAFESILNSVKLASAASAPSVSVNASETRHRDELYYSFFQPYRLPRWDGNVKKYRLLNGEVVDADDQPLLDANGEVSGTSESFWAQVVGGVRVADGENVSDGGMAARQPVNRKWYTDAGASPAADGKTTPYLVRNSNVISPAWLNAASNAERDSLVDWVRGIDSVDADADSSTNDANHYVADGLHNSPVLVGYAAQESTGLLKEAVFTANNMGVVHAVDAKTGDELWSYSPAELLPKIKEYVDNISTSHVYGLDGNLVVHSERKLVTSLDYELEKAWLYLTQRRGGQSVVALDISNALSTTDPFKVMWKIHGGVAGTDFRDLGQTWSTPQVIPVRYGCPTDCSLKNVLMFGGGYNPVYDDTSLTFPVTPAATGHGNAIYMVDAETGELLWSAGNGSHHSLDLPMNDSIPATPVPVDTNSDGAVDILFASDIAGKVWRIDLAAKPATADDIASSGGAIAELNGSGESLRFFNRLDAVVSGNTEGTAYFSLVLGSGMRSSPLHDEPGTNRLHVIKDPWVFSYPMSANIDPATGKRLPEYSYVLNSDNTRSPIAPGNLWQHGTTPGADSLQYGFYKNFTETGEKILQPTVTHSGQIFAVSYIPPDLAAQNTFCAYDTGFSRLHILDLYDGSNGLDSSYGPHLIVGSGIAPNGVMVDTGDGSGTDFVMGLKSEKVDDLLGAGSTDRFRRFIRTGWLEKDAL